MPGQPTGGANDAAHKKNYNRTSRPSFVYIRISTIGFEPSRNGSASVPHPRARTPPHPRARSRLPAVDSFGHPPALRPTEFTAQGVGVLIIFCQGTAPSTHPRHLPSLLPPPSPTRIRGLAPRPCASLAPLLRSWGATPPTFPNLSPARFLPPHDLIIDRHASLVRPLNVVSTPPGFPDLPRHSNFAILATIPPRVYKSYNSHTRDRNFFSRAFRGTIDRSDFGSAPAEPSRTASAEGEPRTPLTTGSVTPAADLPCQPLQREAHRVAPTRRAIVCPNHEFHSVTSTPKLCTRLQTT